MNCKPILFSPPMVRAILEGRKTQTRRIVKPAPEPWARSIVPDDEGSWYESDRARAKKAEPNAALRKRPAYEPGDMLWVREQWCNRVNDDDRFVYNADGNLDASCFWHEATNPDVVAVDGDGFQRFRKDGSAASPWKPGIHMPREACRLWLKVEAVRVERVQDITEADCAAEGIETHFKGYQISGLRHEYAALWDSINGAGSWNANPWVWVYTFSRAEKPEGWAR